MNYNLLNSLIQDEKKSNTAFYKPGKYWKKKSLKILSELKKHDIDNFRGVNNGVGSSFTDSLIYDIRNELNYPIKLFEPFLKMPFISSIFKRQLHITSSYIKKYLEYQNISFRSEKKVKYLLEKYSFTDTTKFGCARKFTYEGEDYSTNYLEVAYRNDIIAKYINYNKIFSFFEIGGGFGSNVHFLLSNFKNIKKIIYLDIVPNIYVGTMYLKEFYGKSVIDYTQIQNMKEITFSKNNDLEIFCIPPWCIENLNIEIDHFHNCASFVEMPKEIIKNYLKYLNKNKMKSFSLFSYSDYDPTTTFDPTEFNNIFEDELENYEIESLISGIDKKSKLFLKKFSNT